MRKIRQNKISSSTTIACVLGFLASTIITVLISIISAIFILNEYIAIDGITFIVVLGQFLSAMIGSFVAGKVAEKDNLIACITATLTYLVILYGTAALIFDGISSRFFWGSFTGIAGCCAAILLLHKKKIRPQHKRRGARSR